MSKSDAVTGVVAQWNGLDWLLAGVLLLSTLRALMRGFVQALFGIAGLLCGFALAQWEDGAAAVWVVRQGWISSPQIARVVCYTAILSGVMVAAGLAGALARRTAHAAGLGMVDRLLGGLVGAVRGVLLGVAFVVMVKALMPNAEWLRNSQLSSYFLAAGHAVSFVVPHTLR